jgi:hypothetical protein
MQRVDFRSALALLLRANPHCQIEKLSIGVEILQAE